ncbi:MAG: hypothetical protein IEMM0002_0166 [bacterium]|nr:MAG: hypothetical protein IEMM0002_0166 [bacterium]
MNFTFLRRWLLHPLLISKDIDDPDTTIIINKIVRQNAFLNKIYREWYSLIVNSLPPGNQPVLEIGSGPGFLNQFIPRLITADIQPLPDIRMVNDARSLPFSNSSLRAIVMVNVLHHIPDLPGFFSEAERCLRPGGAIVAIEPWVSTWSRFIYNKFHHEPFNPETDKWEFVSSGPLSGANGALPWVMFYRDSHKFESQFPNLQIKTIKPLMPFSYLVSGGVSLRQLMPGFTYGIWRLVDALFEPLIGYFAMFSKIVLIRKK